MGWGYFVGNGPDGADSVNGRGWIDRARAGRG